MKKFEESISENSTWITLTPNKGAASLPFYVTEAGHFYTDSNYCVSRNEHDSFLLLYTIKGSGIIQSQGDEIELVSDNAVIIDCHKPHLYKSKENWEFLWLHIKGTGLENMHNLIYPDHIVPVDLLGSKTPLTNCEIIAKCNASGIINSCQLSLDLHLILNALLNSRLNKEQMKSGIRYSDFVEKAVSFIETNYSSPITLEDIIEEIPLSKYHFIRIFKQITLSTPYHYLTAYRINAAKILLRSKNISVSEVAKRCGFSDTSNFINQFKKHTGQKPLEYKNYFV